MTSISSGTPITTAKRRKPWPLLLWLGILVTLYAFGWLAEAVWNRDGLSCDVPILLFIHQYATPARDTAMVWLTHTGGVRAGLLLAALLFVALLRHETRRQAAFLAWAVGGVALLGWLIKNLVQRTRPHLWPSPAPEYNFSFPSGHSSGTMAFALAMVAVMWRTRWRYPVLGLGAIYVGSIGFSRLYLGVHYPSDVLGGWLLSLAWVGGLILLWRPMTESQFQFKKVLRFGGGLAVGALVVLAGYVTSDLAHDNFRVVVPGKVYRSGQMDAADLALYIKTYGIKSIVNLRGKNPGQAWYQNEIATADKYKVVHYDWGFGSGTELSVKRMRALVALLRKAPKPVLIHCAGGADRSGLASALYCFAIEDQKPVRADQELSLRNGHVPLIRSKVIAMDDSFWRYVTNRDASVRPADNLAPTASRNSSRPVN